MKNLSEFSFKKRCQIKVVLTDIDDTLTSNGKLTSAVYSALDSLQNAGYLVMPITGRCAGWCDHIARMWPVDAVVGENGAFYFKYNHEKKKMLQYFCQNEQALKQNKQKLQALSSQILSQVEGAGLASDQAYRLTDLAIDFAEDVKPLEQSAIDQITTIAESLGAIAKVSSIHVNCWFGDHNKLSTSLKLLGDVFNMTDKQLQKQVLFVGDSPNDASMFHYFDNSIGVANIKEISQQLPAEPTYITDGFSGEGFVEVANCLLDTQVQRVKLLAQIEPP
ncbi:MAG: HAD family phosphatase [Rhizobiales bacterium]|nr:HAD family phosphatase [Hyphomicrobiales bacterium]